MSFKHTARKTSRGVENNPPHRIRVKKQRNKCVKMLRQAKFDYYKTLDVKCLTDNRKLWKIVKPLFSDKIQASSKITLLENEVLVTDDKEVAEIFNEYFANITDSLIGIIQPKDALTPTDGLQDPVEIAIKSTAHIQV